MFRKLSRVSVTVSQVYCKISVLSIFVSVHVMSKSIVYFLVIAGNSAPICLLCISDDLLSILAISTSRNVWHFLPHMWSNSFNCWILPLLLNKFGLYIHIKCHAASNQFVNYREVSLLHSMWWSTPFREGFWTLLFFLHFFSDSNDYTKF